MAGITCSSLLEHESQWMGPVPDPQGLNLTTPGNVCAYIYIYRSLSLSLSPVLGTKAPVRSIFASPPVSVIVNQLLVTPPPSIPPVSVGEF